MSKIEKPFGRVCKRIVIEADDKGLVRVMAFNIPLMVQFQKQVQLPMDSREMVLALQRVVMDYTSAMFSAMTMQGQPKEGPTDGQSTSADKASS